MQTHLFRPLIESADVFIHIFNARFSRYLLASPLFFYPSVFVLGRFVLFLVLAPGIFLREATLLLWDERAAQVIKVGD